MHVWRRRDHPRGAAITARNIENERHSGLERVINQSVLTLAVRFRD
jgi:hypothetical protein